VLDEARNLASSDAMMVDWDTLNSAADSKIARDMGIPGTFKASPEYSKTFQKRDDPKL
jgi:hypothetical protein